MSASTTRTPPAHVLIRVTDDRGRVGSLHAALPVEGGFLTACGTVVALDARVERWVGAEALTVATAHDARVCRRCERVGNAVA